MSSLSSVSTDAQVKAAYDDNASYAEDDSITKAKAFITACRILLRRIPKRGKLGSRQEFEFDPLMIQGELNDAKAWLSTKAAAGGGVTSFSFANFRD